MTRTEATVVWLSRLAALGVRETTITIRLPHREWNAWLDEAAFYADLPAVEKWAASLFHRAFEFHGPVGIRVRVESEGETP